MSYLNPMDVDIITPTNSAYKGQSVNPNEVVAISIIRAGDSMLDSLMKVIPEASVGKILIQRDEHTKQPVLFYSKLPNLTNKYILLLDPMLATGGSAKCAVNVLVEHGADVSKMIFVNVLACPEGISAMNAAYPGTLHLYIIIYCYIYIYTFIRTTNCNWGC